MRDGMLSCAQNSPASMSFSSVRGCARNEPVPVDFGMRKVHSFPRSGIAYNDCLNSAISSLGGEVSESIYSMRWLMANARRGDVCLFHWPSYTYAVSDNPTMNLVAAARFVAVLGMLRAKGCKVAWIAHNLMPHSVTVPVGLDRWMRRIVVRAASTVLAHGSANSRIVANEFPASRAKIRPIVHGHFIGLYPPCAETRRSVRARFGIPDEAHVALAFGACMPYKGIHRLPAAIAALPIEASNVHLLVAGTCRSDAYRARVLEEMQTYLPGRHTFHPRFIDDRDVAAYFEAADMFVCPYEKSLTSGSAILAMSFGLPVVAPGTPFMVEILPEHATGLYDPDSEGALESAMLATLRTRCDRADIIEHVRRYQWAHTARVILAL